MESEERRAGAEHCLSELEQRHSLLGLDAQAAREAAARLQRDLDNLRMQHDALSQQIQVSIIVMIVIIIIIVF